MKKRKEARYKSELPRLLYTFFTNYADIGAPSFEKFARGIGVTLEDIERFRHHTEFERAYRECNEIRRDYLIDNALCKRMDSSFAKFILGCEYGMGERDIKEEDKLLEVKLEVIE